MVAPTMFLLARLCPAASRDETTYHPKTENKSINPKLYFADFDGGSSEIITTVFAVSQMCK